MVTSRAVVGSSAMSSLGLQAKAMAIITRWRMPPESWNGYCLATRSGLGIFTSASRPTAFARASFLLMFWWICSVSPIWRSTVNTGFKEVMGSWKMTEISLPRMWYISFSVQLRMSLPSKVISPLSI